MFEFRSPVSIHLRQLLDQDTTTLEEVLSDESCSNAFRSNFSTLVEFLLENIEELVELAFKPEHDNISTKAYNLLTSENDALVRCIAEKGIFESVSEEIFQHEPDFLTLNRLATVFQSVLLKDSTEVSTRCNLLPKFLPFLDERLVFGLFEAILGDTDAAKVVQEAISDNGFVQQVIRLIASLNANLGVDINSPEATAAAGYFRLINEIHNSKVLVNQVESPEVVVILARDFELAPINVLNAQWRAINTITNAHNTSALTQNLQKMIDMISAELNPPRFSSYQADIIYVLAKIARFEESARGSILDRNMPEILCNIIQTYPHNTIGHKAVSDFVLSVDKILDFEDHILSVMLPFCEAILSNENKNIEVRAFSWNLISTLRKHIQQGDASDALKASIGGLESVCISRIDEMDRIADAEYGGELPSQNTSEDEGLANLTSEQIMALLRFLTQNKGFGR